MSSRCDISSLLIRFGNKSLAVGNLPLLKIHTSIHDAWNSRINISLTKEVSTGWRRNTISSLHEHLLLMVVAMHANYFVCTLGEAITLGSTRNEYATITEFLEWRASSNPDQLAVSFPQPSTDSESEWSSVAFSFKELKQGSNALARELLESTFSSLSQDDGSRVVALLCPSSPVFLFTWLALIRLGFSVLLVAPQCAPSAVNHLCASSNAVSLLYDPMYKDLAEQSLDAKDGKVKCTIAEIPFQGQVIGLQSFLEQQPSSDLKPLRDNCEGDIAYYFHTSGTSSGLPKLIPQSHKAAIGVVPSLAHTGKSTFTTTPLYHGGISDCFRAWASGEAIWLFPGRDVPITANNIVKSLAAARSAKPNMTKIAYFSSVPYILQMLADDETGLKELQNMEIVGVGGASLPEVVGDKLVNFGVNLVSRYGSAECGFLMSSHRDYKKDKEWQYLRCAVDREYIDFEPHDDGTYEVVAKPRWPHIAANKLRDDGSYPTSDLFRRHDTISDAWRYDSRADAQLTLATGKKFDPSPLEDAIASLPLIRDALIVGNGRQYPGVLLFPAKDSEEDLLEHIWPDVEKLNSNSQAHARLSKSMLRVVSDDKPMPKSSKGTILRNLAEKQYEHEIENLFNGNDGSDEGEIVPGHLPSETEIPDRVREIITSAASTTISDAQDFFTAGINSVSCMQIRAQLQRQILGSGSKDLPLNVVYDCGNIRRLSRFLVDMQQGRVTAPMDEIELMESLVARYGDFTTHAMSNSFNVLETAPSNSSDARKPTIFLTGATGLLGSHILAHLLSILPSHTTLTLLVRAATDTAAQARISDTLAKNNLPSLPLPDDQTKSQVKILAASLEEPGLGLNQDNYKALKGDIHAIVHAAWPVNFSARLEGFIPAIQGLRNLLDLSFSSTKSELGPGDFSKLTQTTTPPAKLIFVSSTASVLSPHTQQHHTNPTGLIPESILSDPYTAGPTSYARSKWVAEQLCALANRASSLPNKVSILRLGQLCGASDTGVWNTSEAWPLMLSSVKATGCLPDLTDQGLGRGRAQRLDWLPVDFAASAVVEKLLRENRGGDLVEDVNGDGLQNEEQKEAKQREQQEEKLTVLHVLNPGQGSTWADLLTWVTKLRDGQLEVLPPAEWVKKLESIMAKGGDLPALRLLGLWREVYCTGNSEKEEEPHSEGVKKGADSMDFDMTRTRQILSQSMGSEFVVDEPLFERLWRWIEGQRE